MADCSPGTNRFFGPVQTHIKMYQGSFVAVEGPNMTQKMSSLPSIRFPYQQVMTARITLRAGQTNYLLNHLGLGDNATFLAITAQYDDKSKFEADNYIQYSYFSKKHLLFPISHMLVLTGNSENRIEQLYLHNPNQNSAVVLEVMVGVIDEFFDFFTQNDSSNVSSGPTFDNISSDDLTLWDEDSEVMVLLNSFKQPILYLNLVDINAWVRDGKIITIDEISVGNITLIFKNEFEAIEANQKINQWINDVNGTATLMSDPIITFTTDVSSLGLTISPLTSEDGNGIFDLDTPISLGATAYSGTVSKENVTDLIIDNVVDFNSDPIGVSPSNDIIIKNVLGAEINNITLTGYHNIYFDIEDNNNNKVDSNVTVTLTITWCNSIWWNNK